MCVGYLAAPFHLPIAGLAANVRAGEEVFSGAASRFGHSSRRIQNLKSELTQESQ